MQEQKNGVTRPKDGTTTSKVWSTADAISKKTKMPATRSEVMEACTKAGMNKSTVATQYGKWCRFYGLTKAAKAKAKADAQPAGKPAGKAAKGTPNREYTTAPGEVEAEDAAEVAAEVAADTGE